MLCLPAKKCAVLSKLQAKSRAHRLPIRALLRVTMWQEQSERSIASQTLSARLDELAGQRDTRVGIVTCGCVVFG